jgi:hypothetical protein
VIPLLGQLSPAPEGAGLRVTFEAASLEQAAALAAELRRITDSSPAINPAAPLRAGRRRSGGAQTWIVELILPAMRLGAEIQAMERTMLSLEYRSEGSRFLGWTTTATPAMSERLPASRRAEQPPGDSQPPSQRDLVAASLLGRPPAPPTLRGTTISHRRRYAPAAGPYL